MKLSSKKNKSNSNYSQLQELENKIALYTNLRSIFVLTAVIFTLFASIYLIFAF